MRNFLVMLARSHNVHTTIELLHAYIGVILVGRNARAGFIT